MNVLLYRFECNSQDYHEREQENAFMDMVTEYTFELHGICKSVQKKSKIQLAKEYLNTPYTTDFYNILYKGGVAGFCLIGRKENCHPATEIYVQEFYIKPKYRRQGVGTEAFQYILGKHKSVSMFILKRNEGAKCFWHSLFVNWRTKCDEKHSDELADCVLFFLPKANKRLRQLVKIWNQYRYIEKHESVNTHKLAVVASLRQRALNKVLYDSLQNEKKS